MRRHRRRPHGLCRTGLINATGGGLLPLSHRTPSRMFTSSFQLQNPPKLVDARKNSPDWQVAQNVSIAIHSGEQFLNVDAASELFKRMKPEVADATRELVSRLNDLRNDALALTESIDADLRKSL